MHQPHDEEELTIKQVFDIFMSDCSCKYCALSGALEAQVPQLIEAPVFGSGKQCSEFHFRNSAN
jgi:hypothetical protein